MTDLIVQSLESNDESVIALALEELMERSAVSSVEAKRLGPLINKIRKNGSWRQASPLATSLLVKWKPLLSQAENQNPPPTTTSHPLDTTKAHFNRDPTRSKSVELFQGVLSCKDQSLAEAIEEAIFEEFASVNADYRAKVRSKYLNLKQNTRLRVQVEEGTISSEMFVKMSAAEMASSEIREADAKAAAKALRDTQVAVDTEAETDQFKCGRCGKRKCKYYQLQTRSADEPMTTFVTCVNCGNRWKFS